MLAWKFSLWEPQNCLSLDVQKVDSVDTGATYVAATSVILGFKNPFDSLDLVSSATSIAAQWNFTSFNDRFIWLKSGGLYLFNKSLEGGTAERPGSFPRCLKNPTIDSSVVGFNANSNLFWAHSDQHLGKHPYFEGTVVLSRLCWELREALHVDPTRAARQGRESSELQELLKDVESNCFARSQTYRSKMKSWVDFSESLSCSMLMMRS